MMNQPKRLRHFFVPVILAAIFCLAAAANAESGRHTGPWNMDELKQPPKTEWGATSGVLQQVFYENVPFENKPTRVFACLARPKQGSGPFPAMVLVHGGGGKAFPEWATLWAERGYVALAMDLAGCGPDGKRLPDGGPGQDDTMKFRVFDETSVKDMWTYHAVAAVVRGHSLLAALPEVDRDRIGITGISWGGYLTCIVTGIDDRLKVSVPVYGCGFLHENSCWLGWFEKLGPEQSKRWIEYFDPSRYLVGVQCPILFMNGTNDFAYPLDSYQKSYRLIPGRANLSIRVRMPHGHPQGWAPREIGLFVDSVLKNGEPMPRIEKMIIADGKASAAFSSKTPIAKGELHYTSDTGNWQKRDWKTIEAKMADGVVSADLPKERPLIFHLSITDERGALVSAPHVELAE